MSKVSSSKDMTVEELKTALRSHSLPTTGKKSDLQKRLDMWKLPKQELQQRAKKAGLPTTGTKALLVRRIQSGKEKPPKCCGEGSRKSEIVQFGEFLVRILGTKGPIKLDTNIADHVGDIVDVISDKIYIEDIIVIGKENKLIDKADLKKFLNKLNKRQNMPKFNRGRAYIFEGIYKLPPGLGGDYEIAWGS